MPKNNKDFFKTKNNWSKIKDQLLNCYLPQYFQKLLTTHRPIFYVDCFAGKGKFEDGEDGSPRIALEIRRKCLHSTRMQNPTINTCFIDLHHAADLQNNTSDFLQDSGGLEIRAGKYEEIIENLLSNKARQNIFLYIDPYGIQALDMLMFDKFAREGNFASIELLINMNSFGFFRDACRAMKVTRAKSDEAFSNLDEIVEYDPTKVDSTEQSLDLLTRIAGGDYWKQIVLDYKKGKLTGYQAERNFSEQYRQRLRRSFAYVLDMPIRIHEGGQPKYRMIHATQHEDGCFLMAQNMQNRKDELYTYVQRGGQITFFDMDTSVSANMDNEYITQEEIKGKLKNCINSIDKPVCLTALLATFVNDYGVLCDFKMLHDILQELSDENAITIARTPSVGKNGKPLSFWEEKGDRKVVIRSVRT